MLPILRRRDSDSTDVFIYCTCWSATVCLGSRIFRHDHLGVNHFNVENWEYRATMDVAQIDFARVLTEQKYELCKSINKTHIISGR